MPFYFKYEVLLLFFHTSHRTPEFLWEMIKGNLKKAYTELSMDFRRANTEPSVDFRNANMEPSVHFRRPNTESY